MKIAKAIVLNIVLFFIQDDILAQNCDPYIYKFNQYISSNEINKAHGVLDSLDNCLLHSQNEHNSIRLRCEGNYYYYKSYFDSAKYYYVLSINELKLNKLNIEYSKSLINLGNVYAELGYLDSAENYYNESIKIKEMVGGIDTVGIAKVHCSLGLLFQEKGQFKESEKNFFRGLFLLEECSFFDTTALSNTYNNLGLLFLELGDYKRSFDFFIKDLKLISGNKSKQFHLATTLTNLGLLSTEIGNYPDAEKYFGKSLLVKNQYATFNPLLRVSTLNNLATVYINSGKFSKSINTSKNSISLLERSSNYNPVHLANAYFNLAIASESLNDVNGADSFYKTSIALIKDIYGENHPNCSEFIIRYSNFLEKRGEIELAFKLLNSALYNISYFVHNNISWMTQQQQEKFWKKYQFHFSSISNFTNRNYQLIPEVTTLNYNSLLVAKGKMLHMNILKNGHRHLTKELITELQSINARINRMEFDMSIDRKKWSELVNKREKIEKQLSQNWESFSSNHESIYPTWEKVKVNLGQNEVAIEFDRYVNNFDSQFYYQALLINSDSKFPQLVELCSESDLMKWDVADGFSGFYELIWKPLVPFCETKSTIFYSPDGLVSNIPIHALYKPNEFVALNKTKNKEIRGAGGMRIAQVGGIANYLFDSFDFHRMLSTRTLIDGNFLRAEKKVTNSILILGGLDYNYLPNTSIKSKSFNFKDFFKRNKNPLDKRISYNGGFNYLQGSKTEVSQINKVLKDSGWRINIYTDTSGTEDILFSSQGSNSKCILHIATHGYYCSDLGIDYSDSSFTSNLTIFNTSKNAMVRSGLILTGGNWAWTGSDTLRKYGIREDGILTALEVSNYNLKNTQLVVLSACNTGIGDIDNEEGILGLYRGFKLAGVEQIIASLWPVPDEQTQELMDLFYLDLAKIRVPHTSLKNAQKIMRKRYPNQPDLWAGFVLIR